MTGPFKSSVATTRAPLKVWIDFGAIVTFPNWICEPCQHDDCAHCDFEEMNRYAVDALDFTGPICWCERPGHENMQIPEFYEGDRR